MIAGTLQYEPVASVASAYELRIPSSSGYDFFVVLRGGTWVLSGAGIGPCPPTAHLSPELLLKAERAAKFFEELPDDAGGNDPDYGLL